MPVQDMHEFPWFYAFLCTIILCFFGWVVRSIFQLRADITRLELKVATESAGYATHAQVELLRSEVQGIDKLLHEIRGELRATSKQGA